MRITVLKKHSDEILREYNENVPGNRVSGTAEPGIKRGERGKNHGKSDVSGHARLPDKPLTFRRSDPDRARTDDPQRDRLVL